MIRKRLTVLLALALLAQAPPAFEPAVTQGLAAMDAGHYLEAVDLLHRAAVGPDGKARSDAALQMWEQFSPDLTGEVDRAEDDRLRPGADPDPAWAARVAGATRRDAIDAIVRRARLTSIVILNESHGSPRDRAFALEVARALAPLGYRTLAAETFASDPPGPGKPLPMRQLAADGVVRLTTGEYTKDPVFAGFVREAMALGYRPVAYEQTEAQGKAHGFGIDAREAAEAGNLMAGIFAAAPATRTLIYVGASHVAEAPIGGGHGRHEWMAARLKRLTGIDPLTIDQTGLTDLPQSTLPAYEVAARGLTDRSAVLFAGDAPLVLGYLAGAVDLQVVHPPRAYVHDRPAWRSVLGGRWTQAPAGLVPAKGRRLIQLFDANAPADAVPLDQAIATAGAPAPWLLVPAREVRYAVQDETVPER